MFFFSINKTKPKAILVKHEQELVYIGFSYFDTNYEDKKKTTEDKKTQLKKNDT